MGCGGGSLSLRALWAVLKCPGKENSASMPELGTLIGTSQVICTADSQGGWRNSFWFIKEKKKDLERSRELVKATELINCSHFISSTQVPKVTRFCLSDAKLSMNSAILSMFRG